MLHFIVAISLTLVMNLVQAQDIAEIEKNISDTVITTKIKTKFTKHQNLNPLKISASTKNGVVTLRGYVKDKQAFMDAIRLVQHTQGVRTIETEDLEIKHVNTALTDTYITAKVEAAVLKAKVLDDESIPLVGISASTTNGIVTLSGNVNHTKSIAAILKRTNEIHGVKKIISNLQVKNSV